MADAYNSAVRRIDPATGETTTLAGGEPGWADGLEPRFFEPGGLGIAPFSVSWDVEGGVAALESTAILAPEFPLEVETVFAPGTGMLTAELTVYSCTAEAEELCLIERVRIEAPVEVGEGPPR